MRRVTAVAAMMLVAVTAGTLSSAQEGAESRVVTEADLERWRTELSNWGRWGPDDEIGTLNLITPEKRRSAAALVRSGVSVSLARDVLKEEAVDNPRPFVHTMPRRRLGRVCRALPRLGAHSPGRAGARGRCGGADVQRLPARRGSGAGSRRPRAELHHNLKNGVFTRGILMDIPRLKGVPYLEPETPIYVEDLEAWEARTGVRAGAGDAVFIRTGRWAARAVLGPVHHWPYRDRGRPARVGHSVAEGA